MCEPIAKGTYSASADGLKAALQQVAPDSEGNTLLKNEGVDRKTARQRILRLRWTEVSLRLKAMSLAIAFSTLPVLGTGATAYYFANQAMVRQIKQEKQDRATEIVDKINRFIFARYGDIQVLANLPLLRNPKLWEATTYQEKQAVLDGYIKAYKVYDSIAVFNLKGNAIARSQGVPLGNLSVQPYFRQVLKIARPVISAPEISKSSGKTVINFVATVKDPVTGKTIAVVYSRMPVESISEIVKNFGTNGDIYHVFDSSKKYFVVYDKQDLGMDVRKDFPDIAHLLGREKVASQVMTDSENHTKFVTYADSGQLKGLPELNWAVLLTTVPEIAFAPQRQLLLTLAFGTGITALLVGMFAADLASRATLPILAAAAAVEKIGQGKLDTRVAVPGSDELAVLGTNINLMAEQLHNRTAHIENLVQERTIELELTLHNLQKTQAQLIQTEKMSSLGQMVAGVAHEINNPVSFIYGNLTHANEYTQDLLNLVSLYQKHCPNPNLEIQDKIAAIDLDFLIEDLPKILFSMKVGAERIREIVLTLRNFSRLDEAELKPVDIHDGLDSTLLILQHRLKANGLMPGIEVIKEYGHLPLVECCAGQINQVFMNILANAIDALNSYNTSAKKEEIRDNPSTIRIRTEMFSPDYVTIRIADNGSGMTEEVRGRLFDPFFTTKPVGSGTGLGLSISYQIVVEKHKGALKCVSQPGQGAEFWIEIPVKVK